MSNQTREAAKTIKEIYKRLRKSHFPTSDGYIQMPSPGSFNHQIFNEMYTAGYDAGITAQAERVREPEADKQELAQLRREYELSSLGDRPPSMAAAKLKRLVELEALEKTK